MNGFITSASESDQTTDVGQVMHPNWNAANPCKIIMSPKQFCQAEKTTVSALDHVIRTASKIPGLSNTLIETNSF